MALEAFSMYGVAETDGWKSLGPTYPEGTENDISIRKADQSGLTYWSRINDGILDRPYSLTYRIPMFPPPKVTLTRLLLTGIDYSYSPPFAPTWEPILVAADVLMGKISKA